MIPSVEEAILEAAGAGIPHLIVLRGNRFGASDEVGLSTCLEVYGPLAGTAGKAGVALILEMFNTFDHEGYPRSPQYAHSHQGDPQCNPSPLICRMICHDPN